MSELISLHFDSILESGKPVENASCLLILGSYTVTFPIPSSHELNITNNKDDDALLILIKQGTQFIARTSINIEDFRQHKELDGNLEALNESPSSNRKLSYVLNFSYTHTKPQSYLASQEANPFEQNLTDSASKTLQVPTSPIKENIHEIVDYKPEDSHHCNILLLLLNF